MYRKIEPVNVTIPVPVPTLECFNGTIKIMDHSSGMFLSGEFTPYIDICMKIINWEIDGIVKKGKDIDRKRLTEMINSNDPEMENLAFSLLSDTKYSIRLIKHLKEYKRSMSDYNAREIIHIIKEYHFNNMLNFTDEIC